MKETTEDPMKGTEDSTRETEDRRRRTGDSNMTGASTRIDRRREIGATIAATTKEEMAAGRTVETEGTIEDTVRSRGVTSTNRGTSKWKESAKSREQRCALETSKGQRCVLAISI